MDRRNFLKTLGAASGASLMSASGLAALKPGASGQTELNGVLIDTVQCVGCRTCEEVCAEANGLPVPDIGDDKVFEQNPRRTSTDQYSVITRFGEGDDVVHVKRQCMHCNQPACASACLVKAMHKTPEGPVVWDGDKCMGCRFCMLSCPFEIPKFEYNSPNPRVRKCVGCLPRVKEGKPPACVENCPAEALQFGKRRELIAEAHRRIQESPEKYAHHVYGEHEVGGTGMLYLASRSFDKLGFRTDLGDDSYPELTKNFLYSVPVVFTLLPAFLLSLRTATRRPEDHDDHEE